MFIKASDLGLTDQIKCLTMTQQLITCSDSPAGDKNSLRKKWWRLHEAGIGCHNRWLKGRLLQEKKLPVTQYVARYLIYTHTQIQDTTKQWCRYLVLHISFQGRFWGTMTGGSVFLKALHITYRAARQNNMISTTYSSLLWISLNKWISSVPKQSN